ncbi:MAG: hypothetical protein IPP51_09315 [Bacteroidetes bacterium]|nr:hypothetical protein [Bacteroidota bacterium]
MIPVRLNFKGTFQKQYDTTSAAIITPSVIEVSGPPSELAKVDFITTELLVGNDLKADLKAKVGLVKNKLLSYSSDQVQVRIPVEKFTEGSIDLELHAINVSSGYSLKTFPETVKVRYVVPLSYYNKVNPSLFDGIVDGEHLEDSHPDKLNVKLMTKPDFVRTVSIEPQKVDYILRKQ